MTEEEYIFPFQLIAYAGDAKAEAQAGIKLCEIGKFEECEKKIQAAKEWLNKAHELQTELLSREANGLTSSEVSIIMVHAQDHLTMAMMTIDFAERFQKIYKMLYAEREGTK